MNLHLIDQPAPSRSLPRRPTPSWTWFDANRLVRTGRVPKGLLPWKASGGRFNAVDRYDWAFLLDSHSMSMLHLVSDDGFGGYTVMSDNERELRRHFDAVRRAHGRVLKTGLGFGCFVRMCLLNPDVEHIDVVEINPDIAEHFGAQFSKEPRVTVHVADAFDFPLDGRRWDFAWHDIYSDDNEGLSLLHAKLIKRYASVGALQGAWQLERWIRRGLRSGCPVI